MSASRDMDRAANYRRRSHWTLKQEAHRWAKAVAASLPGLLGSTIRRKFYRFGALGRDVYLAEGFYAEYAANLFIGNHVSVNRNCLINAGGGVMIGDWVLIGPEVTIYSQNHEFSRERFAPIALAPDKRQAVTIGSGCWLGARSIVLPGVTLGDRTVVGAGAVVTNSTLPGTVVGGVPAREIHNPAI